MRLTLKAMNYFLTAVQCQSITQAASQLNVVPSAVSAAIDQVEGEFGLKLLMRYPSRGIQPTATGLILVEKIRHLVEEYNNLMVEGSDLRTALSGTLRIGYYAPIAPAFMPDIVKPLIQDNASVTVKFTECDNESAQAGLLKGEYDVILFVAENIKPGIEYETLQETAAYILTSSKHPLSTQSSVDLCALGDQSFVLLDLPFTSEYYRNLLESAGIDPPIVATASTTEMVRSLVSASAGIAILNMQPRINTSYAGEKVVAIPLLPPIRPLKLVLGYIPGNPRRLVNTFIHQCREYFKSDTAGQLIVNTL